MHKIKDSMECCKSELDLFYTLPTNTSILSSSYLTVSSNPLLGTEENFHIDIPGSEEYTDLSDMYLKVEVEITNNGDFNEENFKIGPINNLAHSLFKRVDMSIGTGFNKKLVEIGSSHYAYKAYLLNLLNYGSEAKEGWLQSGMFHRDDANFFNNISMERFQKKNVKSNDDGAADPIIIEHPVVYNSGFLKRRECFILGKGYVKLIIPLHCDLLHSNRFLVNNMGIFFNFERNKDNFLLMGTANDYQLKIRKAEMMLRKCNINDSVKLGHKKALEISDMKYPIRQNKVFISVLDNQIQEHNITTLGSYIPNKIICGLVKDSAYNGQLKENPFEFLSHGLESITLIINDSTRVIKINEDKNDFSEAYHSLCESLNVYGEANSIIKKTEFFKGNCFFCFNINPDKGCHEQFNTIKTGVIQIKLNFKNNTAEKLRLITFMEYDNQININKKLEVNFDYDL